MQRNEAKEAVLRVLSDGSWWTARQIADELDLPSSSHASELLRRYRRLGLVGSQRARRRWQVYRISDSGLAILKEMKIGREVMPIGDDRSTDSR